MTRPVLPGAVIGVLGGGQLGRMFTLAARRMGYRVDVFAPEDDTPAGQIAYNEIRAPYEDVDAIKRFASNVSVMTFEFENVPAAAVAAAARHAAVRPAGDVLHATQDRLREKAALTRLGLPVADYAEIREESDLHGAVEDLGGDCILKSASSGYDGKGQRRVAGQDEALAAWNELGRQPAALEAVVAFEREVSVVGARDVHGEVLLYQPFENAHENHILDVTLSPARIRESSRAAALEVARTVLDGLDVVGVACVEMFVLGDGEVVVNEIAPRPHNSGHLTIDAHATCQFEQQVRAVCGLPLGDVSALTPAAAMANLLGDLWSDGTPDWTACLRHPGIALHLYGKGEARPGRKMGHLTVCGEDLATVERSVRDARASLQHAEGTGT